MNRSFKFLKRKYWFLLNRSSHQNCSIIKVFLEVSHRKIPVPESLYYITPLGDFFWLEQKKFRQQWMFGIILRDFWAKKEKLARNRSKQKKYHIFLISLFSKFVNMDWFQEFGAFQRRIQNPVKHQRCSILWKLLTATNF